MSSDTGTSTMSTTSSVLRPAAAQSGQRVRSRIQRWSGPKMTTSIAAISMGSRKLAITRSDSTPKSTTSPSKTPNETSRFIKGRRSGD